MEAIKRNAKDAFKQVRQGRKSCGNKVVLEQGVNIELESTFSNGMCFVGASQSKDSWKRQYRPWELGSKEGRGESC